MLLLIKILGDLMRAYWKPLSLFLILAYCFYAYNSVVRDNKRLNAVILNYRTTAEAQIEHNKTIIKQQEKITADVVQSYSDSINKLKDYYAKNPTIKFKSVRVYDSSTSSSQVPSVPTTPKGTNADTEGDQPSSDGVTSLDCASDVLNLLTLQKWVREQSSVQ